MPKLSVIEYKHKPILDSLLLGMAGVAEGKMFGFPAYYVNGKLFACLYGSGVGVKVPEDVASKLLSKKNIVHFQPYGKAKMREWIQINRAKPVDYRKDKSIFRISVEFVGQLQSTPRKDICGPSMNEIEIVNFSSAPEVFQKAQAAFDRLHAELIRQFAGAQIEHVGSTALPGSLTKGDLDIQIIISRGEFQRAKAVLAQRYQTNPGAFSSDASASFKDDDANPPVGIHLTVSGCSDDFQWRFRDALLKRTDLRNEYDELKRKFDGKSMADYRNAKERFFERLKSTPEYQLSVATQR